MKKIFHPAANKTISLVLLPALCLSVILSGYPAAAAPSGQKEKALEEKTAQSLSGSGEWEFISISTKEDLEDFAINCAYDAWSRGKVFVLENNIDLSGADFSPVPTFGGIFLGQGHTISGLSLSGGSNYTGLFRYVQKSGEIYQLSVSGTAREENSHTGLGLLAGCNYGLISGCFVSGNITGGDQAAALAGLNEVSGVINGCTSSGAVSGSHQVGGIAGSNKGSIINCRNHSFVNTSPADNRIDLTSIDMDMAIFELMTTENAASVTDIGGIAGSNSGLVRACTNDGSIGYQHVGYNIGGIAGSQMGYIEGCANHGLLNGRKDVGGIAGQMEPSSQMEYLEDTMEKLNTEFNKLHGLLTQLDRDASSASSRLTGQVDALMDSVEGAQNAIDEIMINMGNHVEDLAGLTDLASLPSPDPISLEFLDKLALPSFTPWPSRSPLPPLLPDVTPSGLPDATPSVTPSGLPDVTPSAAPSSRPDVTPSAAPSGLPDVTPSAAPSSLPDVTPSAAPSGRPDATPEETPAPTPSVTARPTETPFSGDNGLEEPPKEEDPVPEDGPSDNNQTDYPADGENGNGTESGNPLLPDGSQGENTDAGMDEEEGKEEKHPANNGNVGNKEAEDGNNSFAHASGHREASIRYDFLWNPPALQQDHGTFVPTHLSAPMPPALTGQPEKLTDSNGNNNDDGSDDGGDEDSNSDDGSGEPGTSSPSPSAAATVPPSASPSPTKWPLPLPTNNPFTAGWPDAWPAPNLDRLDIGSRIDREQVEKDLNDVQQSVYQDASHVLESIQNTVQEQAGILSSRIWSAQNSLSGSFSAIIQDMRILNAMLDSENQVLLKDMQAIIDELNVIGNIITAPQDNAPEDILTDISDQDQLTDTTGKVMNCINYGNVNGDLNAGGIAGSLSRENNLDPENDFNWDENFTLNFRYKERIVVRKCTNTGTVSGKKDRVGGIAGEMALGSIIDCANSGTVQSDGKQVGGIAGYSAAAIRSCSAKCTLSGTGQVGGIAGYGTNISGCYSMVNIKGGESCLGSVAGKLADAGQAGDNYFVEGCPAGIDGISYEGLAEPLPYHTFMASPGLPEMFGNIYLSFLADGRVVTVTTLAYGDTFTPDMLPPVPEKEGYVGEWEDFDYHTITFDQTVNAVYTEYVTAIESAQALGQRPILLLEGSFTPKDSFTLTEIDAYPAQAKTVAKCWEVSSSEGITGRVKVRYLIPGEMENPRIELYENNAWRPIDTEKDGSYYVFTSEKADFIFCCVDRPASLPVGIGALMAGCAGATVLLSLALLYRKKKKKAAK